jgi:hypothetical protein
VNSQLPVGLCWGATGKIEFDPDVRVQNVVRLLFRKFQEFESARKVLLWLQDQQNGPSSPIQIGVE